MKFYGTGVVWNADTEKALCRFDKSGELDTTDEAIIEKLKEHGYKYDKEIITEVKEQTTAKSTEKVVKKK